MSLGLGIERPSEVGLVCLEVSRATHWVRLVVGVDATSGEDGDVDSLQEASIGQVQGTDDIVSHGILLVVLAPVDIWSASRSSCVENVCGLDFLQFSNDCFSVLHADGSGMDLFAWKLLDTSN